MIEVHNGECASYLGGSLFARTESPVGMGEEEEGEGGEGIYEGDCVWNGKRNKGFRRRVAERNAPKTKASSLNSKEEPSSEKPVGHSSINLPCSLLSTVYRIFGQVVVDLELLVSINM